MVHDVCLHPLRTKNCFDPCLFYVKYVAENVTATWVLLRVFRGSFFSIISPVLYKPLHLYEALSRTKGMKPTNLKESNDPPEMGVGGGVLYTQIFLRLSS